MRAMSIALATLLAAAVPGSAPAAIIEHSTQTAHNLFTQWDYTSGDEVTFVAVNASIGGTHLPGSGQNTDDFVAVSIVRFNFVTGEIIISGVAELGPGQFTLTVDGSTQPDKHSPLATAHLVADDAIFQSDEFQFYELDIDLTFTATGPAEVSDSKEKSRDEPGVYFKHTFSGAFRPGTAEGSVLMEELGEFLLFPSTFAELQYAKHSNLVVRTGSDAE